ncbi:hypothetical protein, partial [Pseudomonas syringae group genomosp. 7]|uniref:hypothetical protein n=1 Tax=Pseudomonas syringae group genomosp. 7 TaxID=251699 RepID=UPI00377063CE
HNAEEALTSGKEATAEKNHTHKEKHTLLHHPTLLTHNHPHTIISRNHQISLKNKKQEPVQEHITQVQGV